MKYIALALILINCSQASYGKVTGHAKITGHFSFAKDGEVGIIKVYRNGFILRDYFFKVDTFKIYNGIFNADIETYGQFVAVDIAFLAHPDKFYINYLLEDGDRINIKENDGVLNLEGAKHNFFETQLHLHELYSNSGQPSPLKLYEPQTVEPYFEYVDSIVDHQLSYLESRRKYLSPLEYQLCLTNTIVDGEMRKRSPIILQNFHFKEGIPISFLEKWKKYFQYHNLQINKFQLETSPSYCEYITCIYSVDSVILCGRDYNIDSAFGYLMNMEIPKQTKETILTYFINTNRSQPKSDLPRYIGDAKKIVVNADYLELLSKIEHSLAPNSEAKEFALEDSAGVVHRMKEFKGRVVILDFWYTGCGNCKAIIPYFRNVEKMFYDKNIVFITINTDPDKKKWISSLREKHYTTEYNLNLHANPEDPLLKHYMIDGYPTVLVVSKEGKLLPTPKDVRADNADDLISLINSSL